MRILFPVSQNFIRIHLNKIQNNTVIKLRKEHNLYTFIGSSLILIFLAPIDTLFCHNHNRTKADKISRKF